MQLYLQPVEQLSEERSFVARLYLGAREAKRSVSDFLVYLCSVLSQNCTVTHSHTYIQIT